MSTIEELEKQISEDKSSWTEEEKFWVKLRALKIHNKFNDYLDLLKRTYFEVCSAYHYAVDGIKGPSWDDVEEIQKEDMGSFINAYLYDSNNPDFDYSQEYLLKAVVESLMPTIDEWLFKLE